MMTRQEFLRGGLAFLGASLGWAACSSHESGTTAGATGAATTGTTSNTTGATTGATTGGGTMTQGLQSCATTVQNNHPPPGQHIVTVPVQDVTAGVDKTYHIQGNADHDHTFTLTAANFATLKSGAQVMTTTTTTLSHNHGIVVVCM